MFNVAEIRETLKIAAAAQVQQYPQYHDHFDKYVLARVRKNVKSKMGRAFVKDELVLARPTVYNRYTIIGDNNDYFEEHLRRIPPNPG